MKEIKNLKVRLAAIALAATMAFTVMPSVAYAAENSDDEEILYEETDDNYTQEDIPPVEVPEGTPYDEVHPEETEQPTETETPTEESKGSDEKRDNGPDEFIDADNWSPETDIDPNAGLIIPDYVVTEWERKHPNTTTPDPDPEPTPGPGPRPNPNPNPNPTPDPDPTPDPTLPTPDPEPTPTPDPDPTPTPTPDPDPIPKTADNYGRFAFGGAATIGLAFTLKKILETVSGSFRFVKETDGLDIATGAQKVVASKKKGNNKSKKLR